MIDILHTFGDATRTALGFFWKSGWAFVFGYVVSAMIQAFVPKARLTRFLGRPNARSVALATVFGAASSSCSFAALATARSLVMKGAHFVAAVAFMFASTNLVIELGVLIFIFLGPAYLAAEIAGGIVLIVVSSLIIRATCPERWLARAREKVEAESEAEEEDFDWRRRLVSKAGWMQVGANFAHDWEMVWKEILIGFTIAGFVAALVPKAVWSGIFLTDAGLGLPAWVVVLENAMVAPFVAAATFIGSMGNIPLATVLNANGVLFAGIMGFIYSDLMVPPLVAVNAKYYGIRTALYIAGVMYVSIVLTALILNGSFTLLSIIPQSGRAISDVVRFAIDYTFWLNLAALALTALMAWLTVQHRREHGAHRHRMEGDGPVKQAAAKAAMAVLAAGVMAWAAV